MLLVRRVFAAIVDAVIVLAFVAAGMALIRGFQLRVSDDFVLVTAAGMLIGVECVRLQSFGRFVAGLVIEGFDGGGVGRREIVTRIGIVAMTIAAARCFIDLFYVYHVASTNTETIATYVSVFVIVLWPSSILISGGRYGIHDVVARTRMRIGSRNAQTTPFTPGRYIVSSTALAVVLAAIAGAVIGHLRNTTITYSAIHPELVSAYVELLDDFKQIPNHEDLIRGINITAHQWSVADARDITFSNNPEVGGAFILNDHSFQTVVDCDITTTVDGLMSGDFQRRIAQVLSQFLAPGVIISIRYRVSESIGPILAAFAKRLVVFGFVTADDRRPKLMVIEPDQHSSVELGVEFSDLQRQSAE